MNTEELRGTFSDILNRTDCTEAQVTTLMNLGLGRVERTLRLDLQKTHVDVTGSNDIPLPADFLSLISVKVNGRNVQRMPDTYDPQPGSYRMVYRITEGVLEFPNETVLPLDVVRLSYYKKSATLDDFGANYADLIIYAALTFAADLFVDERKPGFEQTFAMIAAEVQMANDIEQMTGLDMRVRNPYEGIV